MAEPSGFSSQTVSELCDTIAAETSAPGGGSVAAIVTGFAASLAAMAARFSTEQWEDAPGAVAQAEALRQRVLPLADEDARAYESFLEARRLSETIGPEARDAAMGEIQKRWKKDADGWTTARVLGSAYAFAATFIEQRRPTFPAMTWEDTIGNMRALDAWRRAVGVVYEGERAP